MRIGVFLLLALSCLPMAQAHAVEAVDYASYPTFYQAKLPESGSLSAITLGDWMLSLNGGWSSNATITVWDFTDFSHPMRRGSVETAGQPSLLIAHQGEGYVLIETTDGWGGQEGKLFWIDRSDPDAPALELRRVAGLMLNPVSWGDDVLYQLYRLVSDNTGDHWYVKDSFLFRKLSPTSGYTQELPFSCDEYVADGSWLFARRDEEVACYPAGHLLNDGVTFFVPRGSRLVSALDDRVWIQTSPSVVEGFQVTGSGVVPRGAPVSAVGTPTRVLPQGEGLVILGDFGVQVFTADAQAALPWRVARAPSSAMVSGGRMWIAGTWSGIEEISLQPPARTPTRIGSMEIADGVTISGDGRFLFVLEPDRVDAWDLDAPEAIVPSTSLYTGRRFEGGASAGNRLALISPTEVQICRIDEARAWLNFEMAFTPGIAATEGAFQTGSMVLFSKSDGLETRSLDNGSLLGQLPLESMTPLRFFRHDHDVVWLVSKADELVGVSLENPESPQVVVTSPLDFVPSGLTADRGVLVIRDEDHGLRTYRYQDGELTDGSAVLPGEDFDSICLRDGVLYTVRTDETRIYAWDDGAPRLLGLQEGVYSSLSSVTVRGGTLSLVSGGEVRLYPAQLPEVVVPVLVESFVLRPLEARQRVEWMLASPVPVDALRLVQVQDGRPTDLEIEKTGERSYRAFVGPSTEGFGLRLLERMADGEWVVVHEEQVAAVAKTRIGLRILENPVRAELRAEWSQPRAAEVTVEILDRRGRRVARLRQGELAGGIHRLLWNGRDASGSHVARGVYFLRVSMDGRVSSTRFTVVR